MADLGPLGGPIAIAAICFLIFIEEAGVPLPMFPGDGLVLAAGVMIGAGQISPWIFIPCAYVSSLAGALIGFAWTRRVGREGLERLADRLHLRRHLDRAADRLRRTGGVGVVIGRLLPGTRVYTNLVAGATGMELPTFARGLAVSALVWLGVLSGLGAAVGVPAAQYLHQLQVAWGTLVLQACLLAAIWACLRWVRPPTAAGGSLASWIARLTAAGVLDVIVCGLVSLVVHLVLVRHGLRLTVTSHGQPTPSLVRGWLVLGGTTLGIVLGCVAVFRLVLGTTAGEWATRVSYRDALSGRGRGGRRPPTLARRLPVGAPNHTGRSGLGQTTRQGPD